MTGAKEFARESAVKYIKLAATELVDALTKLAVPNFGSTDAAVVRDYVERALMYLRMALDRLNS